MEELLLYSIAFLLLVWAVLILFAKRLINSSDVILAVWLISLSSVYLIDNKVWEFCLTFSHCVFVYLYVRSIIIEEKFTVKWLIHFIPFMIWGVTAIINSQIIHEHLLFLYGVVFVYLSIYSIMAAKLVLDYNKDDKENLDTFPNPRTSNWLFIIIIGVALGYLIKIAPYYFISSMDNQKIGSVIYIVAYSCILLTILTCGIKVLRLDFFSYKEFQPEITKMSYSTYNLEDIDIISIEKRLIDLMNIEKLYLVSDLSLKDLSDALKIAPHNLSFLLNTRFDQNFYEFINNYRIEAVKERLVDSSQKHLSISAIAYDCGFNSLSTFNRVFKQKMMTSPSQYKNAIDMTIK